jgi:hypothetical protein
MNKQKYQNSMHKSLFNVYYHEQASGPSHRFHAQNQIFTLFSHVFRYTWVKTERLSLNRPGNAAAVEISSESGSEASLMHIAHTYTYPATHHALHTSNFAYLILVSSIYALQPEYFPGAHCTPIIVATSSTFSNYKGGPHGT